MPSSITVICPECGARLKLKSRAQLGKKKPCPKCRSTFTLRESNPDAGREVDSLPPISRTQSSRSGISRRQKKQLKKIGIGIGAIAVIGIVCLAIPNGDPGSNPQQQVASNQNTSDSGTDGSLKKARKKRRSSSSKKRKSNTTPNQSNDSSTVASKSNTPPENSKPEALPPVVPRETVAATIDFEPDVSTYNNVVQPFFQTHCIRCHGPKTQEGSFRVDEGLPNQFIAKVNVDRWSEVLNMLNAGEMPPEGEPRPPQADVTKVVEWIEHERLRAERAKNDRTIVLRRMNRAEYNNTIRDLVGVDFRPGDQFPEDPPAAGFDKIGAALTISPMHLEM